MSQEYVPEIVAGAGMVYVPVDSAAEAVELKAAWATAGVATRNSATATAARSRRRRSAAREGLLVFMLMVPFVVFVLVHSCCLVSTSAVQEFKVSSI